MLVSYSKSLKNGNQPVVITTAEAKAQLNITHDHQDSLIDAYILSAKQQIENYTSRSLNIYEVTATTIQWLRKIVLEQTPAKSDVVVQYYDEANSLTTLDASNYTVLNNESGEPMVYFHEFSDLPTVYDRVDAIVITYDVGYATADVPEPFKQYVKLVVTHFYENRSDSADRFPRFADSLLRPYKKWS